MSAHCVARGNDVIIAFVMLCSVYTTDQDSVIIFQVWEILIICMNQPGGQGFNDALRYQPPCLFLNNVYFSQGTSLNRTCY